MTDTIGERCEIIKDWLLNIDILEVLDEVLILMKTVSEIKIKQKFEIYTVNYQILGYQL